VNFEILMLDKDKWKVFSEDAHKICFKEVKPSSWDRVDFALVAIDKDKNQMIGYCTCRELDHESLYWQYGGTFPEYAAKLITARSYQGFINWCKKAGYKRILTYIENTNSRMLKLASHCGFLITGIRNFKGKVLLEHGIEFTSP
jgi:hypothetical protein